MSMVLGMVQLVESTVPALFVFGDSLLDTGNNNNMSTLVKATSPPYGNYPSGTRWKVFQLSCLYRFCWWVSEFCFVGIEIDQHWSHPSEYFWMLYCSSILIFSCTSKSALPSTLYDYGDIEHGVNFASSALASLMLLNRSK